MLTVLVVASACRARKRTVSPREATIFRWFNGAPPWIEAPAWGVMQGGSLGAVFVTAEIVRRRIGARDALVVAGVGTGVWAGIKMVKPAVGRGRPVRCLDDVVTRGQPQTGLGYPSGHAAVAMSLAFLATGPGRWRIPAIVVALLTGCSRIFVGAHLPLDVVGGLAAGGLVGLATDGARSG